MFYSSDICDYTGIQISQVNSSKALIGIRIGNYITSINKTVLDNSPNRLQTVLAILNRAISLESVQITMCREFDMEELNTPFYIEKALCKNGFFAIHSDSGRLAGTFQC